MTRKVVRVSVDWDELGRRLDVACELFWALAVPAILIVLFLAILFTREPR